ncbi:hypothetical protein LTR37_018653 [Vermiconidia calcicola]|uniref:Uncharacterized protein n=1 Tax=Vermiconidia calcicola TaxID=1690605 RepID=A0ACC3MGE3_9PEZI|nr:hypothetical protein LTR37_018653 [Vermiconidia calcicola]
MAFVEWLIHETSLHSLVNNGSRDIYIILLLRFLRMFAYGGAALVLGIFLYTAGNNGTQIGTFLTMTLLGDAAISYMLVIMADRIGRRRVLVIGSLLMTLAGTVFAFSKNYYLLLFAAVVGVISPGAHEVGPFRAVQESILAQLTPVEARTDIYAWWAVTSTIGMACGLSVTGWINYILRNYYDWDWKEGYPVIFGVYAGIGLIKVAVTLLLTPRCEADYVSQTEADNIDHETTAPLLQRSTSTRKSFNKSGRVKVATQLLRDSIGIQVSKENRGNLIRLCVLFAINSFASGMLPVTVMSWYANWRYRWFVIYRLGYAMAGVWLVASIANLFSASVARRLGLVRAMVLTHLPNTIFLAFIPLASTWWIMLMLMLVSAAFGSMDQAPRAAFVAALFPSSERTAAIGTINLVRTIASAGGPLVTGYFHEKDMWWATFLVSAGLKLSYDVGLLAMFLKTELPEHGHGTVNDVDVEILLSDNIRHPDSFDTLEGHEADEEYDGFSAGGRVKYDDTSAA